MDEYITSEVLKAEEIIQMTSGTNREKRKMLILRIYVRVDLYNQDSILTAAFCSKTGKTFELNFLPILCLVIKMF